MHHFHRPHLTQVGDYTDMPTRVGSWAILDSAHHAYSCLGYAGCQGYSRESEQDTALKASLAASG